MRPKRTLLPYGKRENNVAVGDCEANEKQDQYRTHRITHGHLRNHVRADPLSDTKNIITLNLKKSIIEARP